MDSGDFCLHADPDGKAYIWSERPHFQMICATLTGNTAASRYVWLPIEWQGEKPVIRWQKEWRLED